MAGIPSETVTGQQGGEGGPLLPPPLNPAPGQTLGRLYLHLAPCQASWDWNQAKGQGARQWQTAWKRETRGILSAPRRASRMLYYF